MCKYVVISVLSALRLYEVIRYEKCCTWTEPAYSRSQNTCTMPGRGLRYATG